MGPPARRTAAGPQMFHRESCVLLQRDSQVVGLGVGSENSGTSGNSRGGSGSRGGTDPVSITRGMISKLNKVRAGDPSLHESSECYQLGEKEGILGAFKTEKIACCQPRDVSHS